MTGIQISSFLDECTVHEDDAEQSLSLLALYGLYISWSLMANTTPAPDRDFCAALDLHGLRYDGDGGKRTYPGLRMVGPVSRDYIVNSVPAALF